jgi:hypothetical protein
MQQEQFYMDKPYIDAFSELTAISSTDIETLLANNQSATESFTARPAMFVSAVVQKMTIDIMSSDMSYEAKREKLSKILLMDDDISEAIDDNDLDDLLDIASCKPKIEKVLNSYSAFERTSTIYANGVEIGMSDLESYYYYGQLRFERTREYEKEYDKRIFRYYSNRGELELETTFSYTGDGYRYDENSNIKGIDERGYYRSGVLKWEASFVYPDAPDEDEALRYDYEIPYKGQFIDGITKEYYENGVLRQESVGYEAGILNGYRQQYYESGIVKSNTQIQNNKRHGEHKAYNEDGSLRYIIIYKDDKFVNGSCMIGSLKQDNEEYFCIN